MSKKILALRKVQKVGHSFMITLPREFIEAERIERGDKLLISVEDGKLSIEKQKP